VGCNGYYRLSYYRKPYPTDVTCCDNDETGSGCLILILQLLSDGMGPDGSAAAADDGSGFLNSGSWVLD